MQESLPNPVKDLESAIAMDGDSKVSRPLDVIGLIEPASLIDSEDRDLLWRRLFLEAPLPYWRIVNWARKLAPKELPSLIAQTTSKGWDCTKLPNAEISTEQVLNEVANRFDEFNPDLFPWEYDDQSNESPHRLKYLLGRELARSYVKELADGNSLSSARSELLNDRQESLSEWIKINSTFSSRAVCEATAMALDHTVSRDITTGIDGVGRAHILLEQLNVNQNPTAAVVTANLLPIDESYQHLDGIIVPDLVENGLLVISKDFLQGVSNAWRYVRSTSPRRGPTMLCFSVRPSHASVIQEISGRSAELAVLAAIESAVKERVLRPDAAASATLNLFEEEVTVLDPKTGPASFENKKNVAAMSDSLKTVVVHPNTARQWKTSNSLVGLNKTLGHPDVIASEFYRRDALNVLETQSRWKLAYKIPGQISLAFTFLAVFFWQLYKMSATPIDAKFVSPNANLPLIAPALVGSEMLVFSLCFLLCLLCHRSIKQSLDSSRSAWLAIAVCTIVVLLAQYVPVGVRYEGLLDTPLYSILFGEPQITPETVIEQGGIGFLLLHTMSQTVGFITILFGVSAFAIRLIQTRAHTEPIYEDRCELIKKDWRFSLSLILLFTVIVMVFSLARNIFWYYYLTTLPKIELIDNGGSILVIVAPLIGISIVLVVSVGIVWLYFLNQYLVHVVATAQGRAGYTSADVVSTLPPLAKLLYYARPEG